MNHLEGVTTSCVQGTGHSLHVGTDKHTFTKSHIYRVGKCSKLGVFQPVAGAAELPGLRLCRCVFVFHLNCCQVTVTNLFLANMWVPL